MRGERFEREERIETRVEHTGDGRSDASLGDLIRQLTSDTATLVRSEVELAKTEMRELATTITTDLTKIGAGALLALAGLFALTAFLILGLGLLLASYWLAALIVGVLLSGVGLFMAKKAVDDIKERGLTPRQTTQSLKEDAAWAKHESREFKRELTK